MLKVMALTITCLVLAACGDSNGLSPLEGAMERQQRYDVFRDEYKAIVSGRTSSDFLIVDTNKYASVYLAKSCIEETAPTIEGFRSFVLGAVNQKSVQNIPVITGYSKQIVADFNSLQGESTLIDRYGGCATPYQDPATATDARLALEVVRSLLSQINPLFRPSSPDVSERIVGEAVSNWSRRDESDGEPFLVWWCKSHNSAGC